MNELQIVVNQKPGVISTNFEEIKQELSAQMQIYKELEVTEENKAERKKDIATLRKMQKAITEKKSEVRNICLEPYEEFNKQAIELMEIINEPIRIIDYQVKEFEEKQRHAKIAEIRKLFSEMIGDLTDCLPLDKIYDTRWENATTSMKSVRDDMAAKIEKVRQEVRVINQMVSDKTPDALDFYWDTLNMAGAVAMINSYEDNKRRILAQEEERKRREREAELERERERVREEERRRIQEEERIREEERRKAAEAEERIREEERLATERKLMGIKETTPVDDDLEAPFVADGLTAIFTVSGTTEELQQVEMYLNSIGLIYERKDF